MIKTIPEALSRFDKPTVLKEVERRLTAGEDAIQLLRELQEGMSQVGERYDSGEYFLSELLMSARVFSLAMELLTPKLEGHQMQSLGKIVIGTPKGDIHDLGKNIFSTLATSAAFEVHDLGIDVPPGRFVEAVEQVKPQILGFSVLISTAFQPMKETVDLLVQRDLRKNLKIIIGGGITNKTVQDFVGADGQTRDAFEGLHQCKRFLDSF